MLATAVRNGATQALLSAHGFDASMIADPVNHGLATLTAEKVRAGGELIAVSLRGPEMFRFERYTLDIACGALRTADRDLQLRPKVD
jgi:hypothetical protein